MDKELGRQLRAWSLPDTVPATERWHREPSRISTTATMPAPVDVAGIGDPADEAQPAGSATSLDPQVLEPLLLDRRPPRRTPQRVLVAATVIVLAVVAVYAYSRADVTGPIGGDVDAPTTVASTATFGTMPSRAEGGGRVDYSNLPDYIAVVDGRTTSDEIIGYVRSEHHVSPDLPIDHPSDTLDERTTIVRLYNTSEEVIGYLFPDGPVVGAEAEALLATGDYLVDPAS